MYESFDFDPYWVSEEAPSSLPKGLGEMEPSLELARVLAGLEYSSLSSAERVTVITACRRMVSHYQAMSYRHISSLLSTESEHTEDAAFLVVSEIGAALHLTNRGAQIELERALGLDRGPFGL